ncbi:hypothetical protein GCM10009555_077420 [Acrocarpospora macrocephala]|uniref:HTH cro/C1-type domain-containing protein n=1 Tax=Acrocarpospora macrocephala TaxID=150177 RepID=A0A5M3X4C2_9ACTN|nr:helix-turn-helix transcriptional regulator [Acrocarpospora macrocephala]GES15984.1 hypothetical protein Amac_095820 [Acrocarpospora macrocephala]
MPTAERVDPSESLWHLLGAVIRRFREDARRISLREAAKRSFIDPAHLSKWERGLARPDAQSITHLDRALSAEGCQVELQRAIADLDHLRTLENRTPVSGEDATERRRLFKLAADLTLGLVSGSEPIRQLIIPDDFRSTEEWEITCADHLHALRTRPQADMIADLAIDLVALGRQMEIATPADLIELQRTLATLSMIHAIVLTGQAEHGGAIRWWRAARQAADSSGDLSLGLLIRSEEAGHGLYGQRSPDAVLRLLKEAQKFAGGPHVDLMETEAKALSMTGRHDEALGAVHRLIDLSGTKVADRVGFRTPSAIHFAASWVYAAAGYEAQADRERTSVLSLAKSYTYRVNVALHGALCTVAKGGTGEGAREAAAVIANLPPTYRNNHIRQTGQLVLQAVPMDQRNNPGVRELREVLTNSPSEM